MHPILRELHQDHLNLGKVLGLLEKQLRLISQGDDADLHLLDDIVDYVQSYPDLVHHPREDAIFAFYRRHYRMGLDLIERTVDEHRVLLARTAELRDSLDQWLHDSMLPREYVTLLMTDYLKLQWHHLNVEESSVYALLSAELTPDDWDYIEAAVPSGMDPLFGNLTKNRYHNIYNRVIAYSQ
jgi:hemerythrin-like domain-containing protein